MEAPQKKMLMRSRCEAPSVEDREAGKMVAGLEGIAHEAMRNEGTRQS